MRKCSTSPSVSCGGEAQQTLARPAAAHLQGQRVTASGLKPCLQAALRPLSQAIPTSLCAKMEQMPESRPRKQCAAVGRTPEEESGGGLASLMQGKLLHLPQSCSPLCKMEPYHSPGPTQSYMSSACNVPSLACLWTPTHTLRPSPNVTCSVKPSLITSYPQAQSESLCT